ncbi:MAG: hypothetical protein ACYDHG_06730 [Desulfomonilaceae bacterium]
MRKRLKMVCMPDPCYIHAIMNGTHMSSQRSMARRYLFQRKCLSLGVLNDSLYGGNGENMDINESDTCPGKSLSMEGVGDIWGQIYGIVSL